jgi:predicted O-linked N-acetylglucosamine transferase (SPINDLY family)
LEQELTTIAKSIMAGKKTSMPLTALLVKDNPALHKIAAETWINCKHAPTQRQPVTLHKYSDKIRIGYFSADFRQHPVAFLTAELFAQHNRQRFEIIAFSLASEQDDITTRLKPHFDQFLDVSTLTDSDIAQLARDKHIDLAVDLGGHTADNRPGIFAQRAAPVQINYLGYAGTLGATYMDYLLADDIVIPPDQRQHYVEKIAYLPNSFFVNDSGRTVADKMFSRAELGLPEQGFVFCCFNNTVKLNPECFTSWMRILQQVPDSVLWLSAADPQAEQNLKNYAADKGIDPVRILFAQRLPAMADHLARLKQADLFLDTLPYNAHTTASDALWVGLPVLTCMGNAFAGRVAASLLTAIALPELICNDRKAYEASAIELAHNPAKLATIKQKLAKNRLTTPLFNTRQWTTDVESLYEKMLDRHKKGLAPEHLNS